MARLYIKRGTRAQLNTARSAGQLAQSELYHVTDEDKLVLGKGASSYFDINKDLGGYNPNLVLSNWTPGPAVSNSTEEVPVASFSLGGSTFQVKTQWELDIGFSMLQNSGASTFANFFFYFNGTLLASNQNNDNPLINGANLRSGLARIKIIALSATQVAVTILLRLGLGQTVDFIDKGNSWDHTGEFIATIPDLNTAGVISATVQSETAHPNITITPSFACLQETRPNGSVPSGISDGDKGDIIVSNSGETWTIENNSVSLTKIADIATGVLVGRISPATGDPELLTGAQVNNLLQVYPSYPIRAGTVIHIGISAIAPTTQILAVNTLRAFPWDLRRTITISQLRQEISSVAGAGLTMRLGLYVDDPTNMGYPGALVQNSDTGGLDVFTGGVKLYTPPANIVLQPGLYWLVVNANGAPSIRALPTAGLIPILGANPAGGTNSHYTCWSIAQTYGAMPATFPTGAARVSNINAPLTMFTIA